MTVLEKKIEETQARIDVLRENEDLKKRNKANRQKALQISKEIQEDYEERKDSLDVKKRNEIENWIYLLRSFG